MAVAPLQSPELSKRGSVNCARRRSGDVQVVPDDDEDRELADRDR